MLAQLGSVYWLEEALFMFHDDVTVSCANMYQLFDLNFPILSSDQNLILLFFKILILLRAI